MAKRIPSLAGAAGVLLLSGCAAGDSPKLSYAERPCYRTLAEVDCHPRLLPGEESRRVGFYDAPAAVEQDDRWPQHRF